MHVPTYVGMRYACVRARVLGTQRERFVYMSCHDHDHAGFVIRLSVRKPCVRRVRTVYKFDIGCRENSELITYVGWSRHS